MSHTLPLGVTAVMLPDLDFEEQVALCRELGVTHYVFRPRIIPERARDKPWHSHGNHKFDLTPTRLIEQGATFRAALEAAGMVPFCTVPAVNAGEADDVLNVHFEGAAAAGCARMRVAPLPYPAGVFDYPAYLDQAVRRYRELCDLAQPYGIKIVIEMHSGTSATSPGVAYNLVQSFDPQRLGLILDLPNFAGEGYIGPGLAVSVTRPWLDHVHLGGLRRTAGEYDERGFRTAGRQMCALSESDLHIPTWLDMIAAANPQTPLIIEDYSANMTGAFKLRCNVHAARRAMPARDPA